MRIAAAPMIGVASRKAYLAASMFESPVRRPPPIDAPEREKPGINAIACAAPTPVASFQPTRSAIRSSGSPASCTGARRRSSSAPYSITPFSIRKTEADVADANTLRSLWSSVSPRIPAGIVPTIRSHASLASVSSGAMSRSRRLRRAP